MQSPDFAYLDEGGPELGCGLKRSLAFPAGFRTSQLRLLELPTLSTVFVVRVSKIVQIVTVAHFDSRSGWRIVGKSGLTAAVASVIGSPIVAFWPV